MKALVVSNGNITDIDIEAYFKDADIVICADGGARHLFNKNLIPNVIVGDLDSLDYTILKKFEDLGVRFQKYQASKDKSDTELAIEFAISEGAIDIILCGATGTRLDHTIANIMMLYKLLVNQKVNISIVDSHNEIFITKKQLRLKEKKGCFISIIPLVDSKVTLKGFKYETNNRRFTLGSTLGISNVIKDNEGIVIIEEGACLVIRSRD
ncbi:thiamine pyrophosphokinase [Proteiniborus ethanoligenes]|uniref:Thiamine diphosphokinase n=1 Tax=Proteiniborus ethanoligenes TaxID=415015 RepID=A0A1H3PL81_9FIRM|nr:thiamine diphosphokinase [Proteiniborus ethanoligenes]SDZ01767.1 thiamine pyrophosphokinase [Proteiniborus ethanoligenes]